MKKIFKHNKYFGKPLSDIQRRKTGQCDKRIPSLVYVCVMYLSEPEHIVTEGLFRKSGQESDIEKVKKIINTKSVLGQKALLIKAFDEDIFICTSILKKFLHELPTPIINQAGAIALRQVIEYGNARELFLLMDSNSADIFVFMMIFLNYLTKFSSQNKMHALNLAICFAPVFCRIGPSGNPSIDTVKEALRLIIEDPQKFCPPQLYNTFIIPFQYFISSAEQQQSKQHEMMVKETRMRMINPKIEKDSDIVDYVLRDRQIFQRAKDWNDMSYTQLVQEYEAMKLATSYYLYNSYFRNNSWPEGSIEGLMNPIQQLKVIIKQKENQIQPDCSQSYRIKLTNDELDMFPLTIPELAAFIADIQTEIITIQHRINQMPDPVTLRRNGDMHTFAERKCLIVKQGHCLRINEVIRQNIDQILRNTID